MSADFPESKMAEFKNELKAMILYAAEKDQPEGGISDDEILFGPESRLTLDSLDALQISMEIQKRYGVRMPDSKDTRRALSSISNLAEYISTRRK